jgi:predicted outer membrane repeat protein
MFSRLFRSTTARQPRRSRPGVEQLEERAVPATFTVNSLADILNPGAGTVTLRSAVQSANTTAGNNTIVFTQPGTYRLTALGTANETDNVAGELAYTGTGNLTIVNNSGGRVVIDGGGLNRVFDLNPGAQNTTPFTVTFQGLTITDGSASPGDADIGSGGGIRAQGAASVVLNNVTLSNNTATADGGGIALESIGTLTINNSLIVSNHAGDAGGGVESDGNGTVTITGTTILANTCVNQGAGVWLDAGTANLNMTNDIVAGNVAQFMLAGGIGNAGTGNVTLVGCTIENNSCGSTVENGALVAGTGGGFGDAVNMGNLTVANCLFLDNSAAGNGGGIQEGGPVTTITGTVFEGNVSGGDGGGLFVNGTTVSPSNDVFRHNVAVNGGALETDAGSFAATQCSFEANRALGTNGGNGNTAGTGGAGGAVFVTGNAGATTFTQCLFLNNAANNGANGLGGAIDDMSGNLTVNTSQFTGNISTGGGGAIFFNASRLNVIDSTFNGNRTLGSGGAIDFTSTNPATLQDDTFTGNSAAVNGGAIFDSASSLSLLADTMNGNSCGNVGGGVSVFNGGSVALTNTLIAGNTTAFGAPDIFSLTITDNGGNLIGIAPPGFGAGTLTGVNPLLGRLENNGGVFAGAYADQQIVQTEALLPGSPAIGAGVIVINNHDERHFPSPAGGRTHPSIGAYEPQYATTASANQIFVENLYEVLLNRPASLDPGSGGWVTLLNQGVSRLQVVLDLEGSAEYLGDQVQLLFQRYLHRTAGTNELSGYISYLGNHSFEQVQALLAGSGEYYQLHGGNNEGFLEALFLDVLDRSMAGSELTNWQQALDSSSAGSVAAQVFASGEYLGDLVALDFQTELGRPIDFNGLSGFTSYLQAGATDQLLTAQILGSTESFLVRS